MPKSFESDILLIDDALPEPIKATLSVNKPLIYKDYAIYQSSFGDGGSQLTLNAWPLLAQTTTPTTLNGEIHLPLSVNTPAGDYKIELDDYKTNNVIPLPDNDPSGRKHKNLGPSVQFKVRDSAGQAVEYENYVTAIDRNGHWYQVSKYRHSMAEPFEFLMIPLDDALSMKSFMNFLAKVNDRQALNAVLDASIAQETDTAKREELMTQKKFMQQLVNLFRMRGFEGIQGYIEQAVAPEKREQMMQQYVEILTVALQGIYISELEKQQKIQQEISEDQRRFFADSIEAISQLANYGPPMLFEVTRVESRESSGLQITKSPGKNVVYLGSFLLVLGVFLLFYVRPQRIWCMILPAQDGHTEIILAGKDAKNDAMMQPLFSTITQQLQSATSPVEEHHHA
jgi:cytochrome c biogenesis protein